jgi:hypothetical protein
VTEIGVSAAGLTRAQINSTSPGMPALIFEGSCGRRKAG